MSEPQGMAPHPSPLPPHRAVPGLPPGFELAYQPPPPPRADYGVGVIGAGFIVRECHLPAYREAGYRVLGVASRSADTAREVAAEWALPRAYRSVEALLADPEVEVVDIAVPPHEQPALVARAAAAGKHVLAQKPLARDLAGAREAVRACEAAGVHLVVNQNGRYDPAIRAAKALLDAGELGAPVLATIELRFTPHWRPYQLEYDRLMFLFMSIHHLDQFRLWFGMPERLTAHAAPHPSGEYRGEYLGTYTLEYPGGLLATAWDDGYAWDPEGFGVFYKLEGTEGVARMEIGWPTGGPSALRFLSRRFGDAWHAPPLEGSWFPGAFRHTMGELFRTLATGEEGELSGRANLATMALVEACYRSTAERRAVELAELLDG